jgi:magnesium chelatase subunit I
VTNLENASAPKPRITTLGGLREAGVTPRPLRQELRENLLAALVAGDDPWPGLHGLGDTVLPQVERALIAGHDIVLLGERGQGKSRLLRALTGLLDEWSPAIAGTDLSEDPYDPITAAAQERVDREGDDLPIVWRHRSERFVEKLATPDTSVADVIGDVDPMRVAEGRSLSDPETIHFGLVPRAHRGIVANPEDYTNRGRIITPLKDRFGAEIRTHYPPELADEIAVVRQEAHLAAHVPDHLIEILARLTRGLRESPAIDQSSGVSARFTIAAAETVAAAARRRAALAGAAADDAEAVARPVDLVTLVDVLRGKLEFEPGEEGTEREVLDYGLRVATAETARERLAGLDLGPLVRAFEDGLTVATGETVSASGFLAALPELEAPDLYDEIAGRLEAASDGERAAAVELALEGLYLSRKLAKETGGGRTVYG